VAALRADQPQTEAELGQPGLAAPSSPDRDPVREAQKRGQAEWLKLREEQTAGLAKTPEGTRAQARDEWVRLRDQQAEKSPGAAAESKEQQRNRAPEGTEQASDPQPGLDEDPDS
jgi:hypothetical protein